MSIALRNLLKDKTRFALSVIGVALAVMLILLLGGFLSGMNTQITAYLDHAPGSVVVAQDGVCPSSPNSSSSICTRKSSPSIWWATTPNWAAAPGSWPRTAPG